MAKKRKKLLIYGGLTLLMMLLIFYFSAQNEDVSAGLSNRFFQMEWVQRILGLLPKLSDQEGDHDLRKYAHMLEYLLLSMSATSFFWELLSRKRMMKPYAVSTLFCFLYACSDEWHQSFVPGRAGRASDVMIDMIGVLTGLFLVFLCNTRKEKG